MCHHHGLGWLDTGCHVSECFSDCTINKADLDFEFLVPASPGLSFITMKVAGSPACLVQQAVALWQLPSVFSSSDLSD